jgi:hypothetical protein
MSPLAMGLTGVGAEIGDSVEVVPATLTVPINPTTAIRTPIEQRRESTKGRRCRPTTAPVDVPNDFLAQLIISLVEGEFDRFRIIFMTSTSVVRTKAFAGG